MGIAIWDDLLGAKHLQPLDNGWKDPIEHAERQVQPSLPDCEIVPRLELCGELVGIQSSCSIRFRNRPEHCVCVKLP